MTESPSIHSPIRPKRMGSRRKTAHAMFLNGSTLGEVIEATGLEDGTARLYLYEARRYHADRGIIPVRTPEGLGADVRADLMAYLDVCVKAFLDARGP
jgi:hypothetical protein